jgi:hypothetical protein
VSGWGHAPPVDATIDTSTVMLQLSNARVANETCRASARPGEGQLPHG